MVAYIVHENSWREVYEHKTTNARNRFKYTFSFCLLAIEILFVFHILTKPVEYRELWLLN